MKNEKIAGFISSIATCVIESLVIGLLASLFLSLLIVLLAESAQAEVIEGKMSELVSVTRTGDVKQGSFLFRQADDFLLAPLLMTDVDMDIYGMLIRVTLKQQFSNVTNEWQEGIYVFPLPENAAVDSLRMQIGERIIEGEIREKKQARAAYKKARSAGRKASLVEQERPNIFTASVANIAPGESITVEIQYQHTVHYNAGEFSLRFPMVVAPRYIPGKSEIHGFDGHGWATNTDQVPDAARITPPVLQPGMKPVNPVTLHVDLNAGVPLQHITSSFHAVRIDKINPSQFSINLDNGDVPADRDFEIRWQPEPAHTPRAALFNETHAGHQYALVMLLPPEDQKSVSLNREVVFVVDTSGSMGGTSIRQARNSLLQALDRLKNGDRFNIIQFNSRTSQLYQLPQPLTHHSLRQARSYVLGLEAGGGTEIMPALGTALEDLSENTLVRQIIFITDGSIGNEGQLFETIQKKIGKSRLFTVGIGSAPNSFFMRRAAEFGKGTYTFIGQVSDVEDRMQELFAKLESPVLTELSLEHDEQDLVVWPENIPDLYKGEPLLLALRAKKLPATINVNGLMGDKPWQSKLHLQGGKNSEGVARLWARKKITSLMNQWHLGEDREEIQQMITDTALENHLVSKFTSLIAIDKTPARVREALLNSRPLPVNLPHGWQYEKVFGQLPATATPARYHFITGFLVLFFTVLITFLFKHVRFY